MKTFTELHYRVSIDFFHGEKIFYRVALQGGKRHVFENKNILQGGIAGWNYRFSGFLHGGA